MKCPEAKINDIKKMVRDNIIKEAGNKRNEVKGGQSCGVVDSSIRLISQDLNIEIMIGDSHSMLKNHNLAMTIMDLLIDELIK